MKTKCFVPLFLCALLTICCSCETSNENIDATSKNKELLSLMCQKNQIINRDYKIKINKYTLITKGNVNSEKNKSIRDSLIKERTNKILNNIREVYASYTYTNIDKAYYHTTIKSDFYKNHTSDEVMTFIKNNGTPTYYNILQQLKASPKYCTSFKKDDIINNNNLTVNEKVSLLLPSSVSACSAKDTLDAFFSPDYYYNYFEGIMNAGGSDGDSGTTDYSNSTVIQKCQDNFEAGATQAALDFTAATGINLIADDGKYWYINETTKNEFGMAFYNDVDHYNYIIECLCDDLDECIRQAKSGNYGN